METYRINTGFRRIQIFDRFYLLAKKETRKEYPVLTPLNDTAELIWIAVSEGKSLCEVAEEVASVYDIDAGQAYEDVLFLCREMNKYGYMHKVEIESEESNNNI